MGRDDASPVGLDFGGSADASIDGFYYAALASAVDLTAGMKYVLGAMHFIDDSDSYWSGPATITTNYISMTEDVFPSLGNLGFVFPTESSPGNLGRIVPNMLATPSAVPEPGTLTLPGLGLVGIGLASRRKNP